MKCSDSCIHFEHDGDTQDVCLAPADAPLRACDIEPDYAPTGYDSVRDDRITNPEWFERDAQ